MCSGCKDTGSRSRDLHGYLDCPCGIAEERVTVETWARDNAPNTDPVDAWLIYQFGKSAAQNTQTEAGRAGA
jgi:hypothetical protein